MNHSETASADMTKTLQRPPAPAPEAPRAKAAIPAPRVRDLRLDFFRGLAMFIILVAHIPFNAWGDWIPARFGFSDATEIFVFCSGMASAIAFGGAFLRRGWLMGTARVLFRCWQVYWAHICLFFCKADQRTFSTFKKPQRPVRALAHHAATQSAQHVGIVINKYDRNIFVHGSVRQIWLGLS